MQIIGQKILTNYCRRGGDSELTSRVNAWIQEAKTAKWQNSQDLKSRYPKASIITKKDTVFDLLGNKYRLWTKTNYSKQVIFIKKVGIHAEYDKWDIKKGKG